MAKQTKLEGIILQIGGDVSGLAKALADVDREINHTQKQLKEVQKLLKLDPGNTELLCQQQRLLAQQVEQTSEKLRGLQEAQKQARIQLEKGNMGLEQYEALQREIIQTQRQLEQLEEQAKSSDDAMNRLSMGAGNLSSKASKVAGAMAPATAAIAGMGAAALASVGATEDYRQGLAKLEVNAKKAGVSMEEAKEALKNLNAIAGDSSSNVEALSNLLAADFQGEDLSEVIDNLAGAVIRFPDTLTLEALADSLQETIATRTAVGQFAELLDRLGIGAEEFSSKLARCKTEAQAQELALKTLAQSGLAATTQAYRENNEALIANKNAQFELNDALAELAVTMEPLLAMLTQILADLLEAFNSLPEGAQKTIAVILLLVAAISPLAMALSSITGLVSNLALNGLPALSGAMTFMSGTVLPALGSAMTFIATNPVVLLIAAITALIGVIAVFGDEMQAELAEADDYMQNVFAKDWTEQFGVLGNVLNTFSDMAKGVWDRMIQRMNGFIDVVRGIFTGDWERVWQGAVDIFTGTFGWIGTAAKDIINGILTVINGFVDGINLMIRALNTLHIDLPDWLPFVGGKTLGFQLKTLPSIPYLAKGGILSRGSAVVGEKGPELLSLLSGGRAQVTPLTGSDKSRALSGQVVYQDNRQNIFKVDDIATYQAIEQRMKREQMSYRMGYAGR